MQDLSAFPSGNMFKNIPTYVVHRADNRRLLTQKSKAVQ